MQVRGAARRHGLLDRDADQLVAERDRAAVGDEQAALHALVELGRRLRRPPPRPARGRCSAPGRPERPAHPWLPAVGARRGRGRRHEPCPGRRRPCLGQDLGHEEGVAARPSVELDGVDAAARREAGDGRRGQHRHGQPPDDGQASPGRRRARAADGGARPRPRRYVTTTMAGQDSSRRPRNRSRSSVASSAQCASLEGDEGRDVAGSQLVEKQAAHLGRVGRASELAPERVGQVVAPCPAEGRAEPAW